MDLEAGVQIGDFRIERRLGAGGMGIVYQARQVSLDRTVALKILGSALDRDSDIARFRREAQAAARLNHPAIADVYFIGQDEQVCYMAMEFVDGVSLRTVIDQLAATDDPRLTLDSLPPGEATAPAVRFDGTTETYTADIPPPRPRPEAGPISPEASRLIASPSYFRRCCEVVRDAALALSHAHGRGVTHRDIKPENLMLDRDTRVHIIDFGIARFFEDMTVTNTGQLVGTPMYMSPEQVSGMLLVDHRTDIYSLGLVLYELLTLRRPITAPTREGILRQIATKALPPVSWRNRAVPRDLEGVVHKATAKDPDERYQSAADLAAEVQDWLEGRPVAAAPYRYRFDPREVTASRPQAVLLVAFWTWFASLYCVLVGFEGIVPAGSRRGTGGLNASSLVMVGFGVWYLLLGRGLLLGRTWSLWAGIVTTLYNVGLFAMYLYRMSAAPAGAVGPYSFSLFSAIAVCWLASLAVLLRRGTRDWFRLAARLRAEHERMASPGQPSASVSRPRNRMLPVRLSRIRKRNG